MIKINHAQLRKKIDLLSAGLLTELKNNNLSANALKWVEGLKGILESKTYIASNIDDVLWFAANNLWEKKKVLDFGAGGGYITLLLSSGANDVRAYEYIGDWTDQEFGKDDYVSGFSFAQKVVNQLDGGIKFNYYQNFPLQEEPETYDAVVLYAVIEHLEPTVQNSVFKELRRLLKPDGVLYIAKLPRSFSHQEWLARQLGLESHSNLFTKKKIKKLLEENGFEIVKIEKSGLFFNHPNKITNLFFPVTSVAEKILKYTPINLFAHDYRLIARKK